MFTLAVVNRVNVSLVLSAVCRRVRGGFVDVVSRGLHHLFGKVQGTSGLTDFFVLN